MSSNDSVFSAQQVLAEWDWRLRVNVDTHNLAERYFDRRQTLLAILATGSLVVLGVSAGVFDLSTGWGRGLLIALTLLGSIASVLQSHLGDAANAARHQTAARQYAALRRATESAGLDPRDSAPLEQHLEEIRREWDTVAGSAPNVPNRLRRKAKEAAGPSRLFGAEGQRIDELEQQAPADYRADVAPGAPPESASK